MPYKQIVNQITELPWSSAAPQDIILVSRCTAIEFAESLRMGCRTYPTDKRLLEMAQGELDTTNMTLEDYTTPGDHWRFLEHFVKKLEITPTTESLLPAMYQYTQLVASLEPASRAMTVFSREMELSGIFKKIRASHDWIGQGFGFYEYYLSRHIHFDSGASGHGSLTSHFPLNNGVLCEFYTARKELYQALFSR